MHEQSEKSVQYKRTLFVGLGSPHGDDQAGWLVAAQLEALLRPLSMANVVIRYASSPIESLHWLDDCERLIACDAYRFGGNGIDSHNKESICWTWPFPSDVERADWSGTHDMSFPATLQLGQSLGMLPEAIALWGVLIDTTPQPMAEPSPVVSRRCDAVARQIAAELAGSAMKSGEAHA